MSKLNPGYPLDPKIKQIVLALQKAGIETYESCQGGKGHCSNEAFVRFHGTIGAGYKAVAVALEHDFKIVELRRVWPVLDKELKGPVWELIFIV